MDKLYQVFCITGYNFRQWKKNPQIIMSFVMAFVLCLMLSGRAVAFANSYDTTMQIFEAFVWAFGDAKAIMMSSMLLLLFFADMPFISKATPYYLIRGNRSVWVWGQILYIILVTVLYMLFLLVVSCILCERISFVGNMWSETGALLGYSGVGAKIALPASVKTMEMSLPWQCMLTIFLLITLYSLMTATLMMVFHLRKNKFMGILSVLLLNIYGIVLNPEAISQFLKIPSHMQYQINVLVGWISPLNHATYYMHNFGYDYLPRIWQSSLIFICFIFVNLCLIHRQIRKYEFHFS